MPREQEWKREIRDVKRHEDWALSGSKMLVKLTAFPTAKFHRVNVSGYFTTASSLSGKTFEQIIVDLGLPKEQFMHGVQLHKFLRLPTVTEYTYELTARYPDGLAASFLSDERYPPGSTFVHQWKLRDGVAIPSQKMFDLRPCQTCPAM